MQLDSGSVSSSQLDPKFKTGDPSPTAPPCFSPTLALALLSSKPIKTTDLGVPFSFRFSSSTPGDSSHLHIDPAKYLVADVGPLCLSVCPWGGSQLA